MVRIGLMATVAAAVVVGGAPAAGHARIQGEQGVGQERYGCIVCHAEKRRTFRLGIHSERRIRCHDCHGGDPSSFDQTTAHSGDYIGTPDKIGTIRLCSSCHSDPDRMRQYGLAAGQLAAFRTSRHGELLLERGDMNAPTCTDCHDAHTILPPSDARSTVHPANIPGTCGRCHRDPERMERYGLGTDQFELYRESVHGVELLDRGNFAAPSCIGCHGAHGALPPRVTEIANVCGQCHVLVRRAFFEGPHGDATLQGTLGGCTACHSNHGTERFDPARIQATCSGCHRPESTPTARGAEIQAQVSEARGDIQTTQESLDELVELGTDVTDLRFRYQAAWTAYRQMVPAQHRLDMEKLDDLARRVASVSRDVAGTAEVAREHRWEHKLFLVPVWFLALAATVLVWFKLRAIRREES